MAKLFKLFREFEVPEKAGRKRQVTLCLTRVNTTKGCLLRVGYSVKRTDDRTELTVEPGRLPLNRQIALGRSEQNPMMILSLACNAEDENAIGMARAIVKSLQDAMTNDLSSFIYSVRKEMKVKDIATDSSIVAKDIMSEVISSKIQNKTNPALKRKKSNDGKLVSKNS